MKRTPLPGTPEPMHTWAGFGGVQLAGDSWGDGHGPLVLLLHGVGQTRHAWGQTGKMLGAAGYHAVAFDARGHGDSDWAIDGDYTCDAMIRDLHCVIAALGGRQPVLVGASMGGGTSLVAVGEGHLDASALVLVDIAPRMEPTRVAKNVRLGSDGKYHWHWDPRLIARAAETDERRVEAARRLTLPTLLVSGGHSDVASEQGVQDFLALCPHSEYVNVAGAGHMVAGERNDVFARAALAFLQRALPSGAHCPHP
jgi:pimeloyl-ACP methyl ester carboxylesterase